jgi:c-di-GMP-binding flagellar brake protein YcgR
MLFRRTISQDSRVFRRVRAFAIIKYSITGDPAHSKTVVNPRNISAGGALFMVNKKLSKGTIMDIELYLPPLKDFFSIVASVVDSSRIDKSRKYWTRIKFTAIAQEDRRSISAYIEDLANDPEASRYLDKKGLMFKRNLK